MAQMQSQVHEKKLNYPVGLWLGLGQLCVQLLEGGFIKESFYKILALLEKLKYI